MIVLLSMLLLAQAEQVESKVICIYLGSPVHLGDKSVTIPTKCCSKGSWLVDPNKPTDSNGDLICSNHKPLA